MNPLTIQTIYISNKVKQGYMKTIFLKYYIEIKMYLLEACSTASAQMWNCADVWNMVEYSLSRLYGYGKKAAGICYQRTLISEFQ